MILPLVPPVTGAALIAAPCHAMAPAADDASPDDVAIRPFRVSIPQAALDPLGPTRKRFPIHPKGAQLAKMQELVRLCVARQGTGTHVTATSQPAK
jgi:hypothetical protein